MIVISQALRWLNHFDRSHMNGTSRRTLAEARNRRTNHAAVPELIRAALQQARSSPYDSLDYAETLLNCSEVEHNRRLLESARDHAAAAMSNYVRAKDVHGAAVAAWMYGVIELVLQNSDATYRSWKRALRTFERFRDTNRHIPDSRKWYVETAIQMNKDLVTLPQESYSWLKRFDGSCISPSNQDLVKILDDYIATGNQNEANRIINVLKDRAKASSDPYEQAEIFAETGLARFRMREISLAVNDLKVALRTYPSESHQQECTRWLLGAVQFWAGSSRAEAVTNWEKGIEGFTRLARTADQNNQATRKRWYRDRIVYMKGALKGKLAERPSGEQTDSTPPEDGYSGADDHHSPQPRGPDQRQNGLDVYQNLLGKARGDAALVERLIRLEQQRAPNLSRDELIRRAIERWERDNR